MINNVEHNIYTYSGNDDEEDVSPFITHFSPDGGRLPFENDSSRGYRYMYNKKDGEATAKLTKTVSTENITGIVWLAVMLAPVVSL